MPRRIEWVEVVPQCGERDAVVWVDIAKLDALWAHSDEYIGPGGSGRVIGTRYPDVGEWILAGNPLWMSEIALNEGRVEFTNGRHRFAWLRDHGARALPVQIDPARAAKLRALCGSKSKKTALP